MSKISAQAYAGIKDVLLPASVALTLLSGPAPATADDQRRDPYLPLSGALATTASNLALGVPVVIAHDGKLERELNYHIPIGAIGNFALEYGLSTHCWNKIFFIVLERTIYSSLPHKLPLTPLVGVSFFLCRAGYARTTEPAVAVGILSQVLLVIIFGVIERRGPQYLR